MKGLLYIVWNEKNNIGVPIIDEQHRGIVIAINSLYYFINERRTNKVLQPTLTILKQYTKLHFMTEEKLMKDANYPAVEEHILIHKKLAEKSAEETSNIPVWSTWHRQDIRRPSSRKRARFLACRS